MPFEMSRNDRSEASKLWSSDSRSAGEVPSQSFVGDAMYYQVRSFGYIIQIQVIEHNLDSNNMNAYERKLLSLKGHLEEPITVRQMPMYNIIQILHSSNSFSRQNSSLPLLQLSSLLQHFLS